MEPREISVSPVSTRGTAIGSTSSVETNRPATQTYLNLQREPKRNVINGSIRAQLTEQEIRDIQFVFNTFANKENRLIEANDLYRAMRVLGFKIKMSTIDNALIDIGADEIRCINFEQFLEIVVHYQGESRDIYDEIMQGFKLLDTEKRGFITYEDIKKACNECGLKLSDKAIKEMLEEADQTGNSMVTAKEFMDIMMQTQMFQCFV